MCSCIFAMLRHLKADVAALKKCCDDVTTLGKLLKLGVTTLKQCYNDVGKFLRLGVKTFLLMS